MSDHFGSWFSGFVDGEGYFGLQLSSGSKKTPRWYAHLTICLRGDDEDVLRLISDRFGGTIVRLPSRGPSNPSVRWRVATVDGCVALVDHFEKFPLFGKKQRDFELWAVAVRHMGENRGRRGYPMSSNVDNEYLSALAGAMQEIRKYGSDGVRPYAAGLRIVSEVA